MDSSQSKEFKKTERKELIDIAIGAQYSGIFTGEQRLGGGGEEYFAIQPLLDLHDESRPVAYPLYFIKKEISLVLLHIEVRIQRLIRLEDDVQWRAT